MGTAPVDMTIRDYGRVIVRRRWLIGLAVLTSVLAALLVTALTDPIYESEARMLIETRDEGSLFDNDSVGLSRNEERALDTEIQVLASDTVRRRVQDAIGSPQPPPKVTGASVGQTDVVSVTVRSADERTAQILADEYVDAYVELRREQGIESLLTASAALQEQIGELQTQIDGMSQFDDRRQPLLAQQAQFEEALNQIQVDAALRSGGAWSVKPANLPNDPIEPQPVRSVALAAAIGMLVGLAAAFLVDYLDDSVVSPDDLHGLSTLPTLATLPLRSRAALRPLTISHPHEHSAEIYRGMRTSLQILGLDRPIRTLQVTSAVAGEGKTTTSANLAVVLAQAGRSVVIVDADQRHPRLHQVFDVPQVPGLTDLVLGESLDSVVHRIELEGPAILDIVAAGQLSPQPSDTLGSQAMRDVLNSLMVRYDHVIIDSAPVLPVTDAVATAPNVDAVLLVIGAGTTGRTVSAALSRLDQVAASVIGLVLNKATTAPHSTYEYSTYVQPASATTS